MVISILNWGPKWDPQDFMTTHKGFISNLETVLDKVKCDTIFCTKFDNKFNGDIYLELGPQKETQDPI